MFFLTILIVLLVFYALFLTYIFCGTFKLFYKKEKATLFNQISIVVAARNEEKNISILMDSLLNQNYPIEKFEIVIVSDRSKDKTNSISSEYSQEYDNVRFFKIEKNQENLVGKKAALTKGIENAKNEILLFTDADCSPSKNWLKSMNSYFNQKFDVVVGYSPLKSNPTGILQKILFSLKKLERLSIFTISAGTIGWNWGVTATGRNFAYRKKIFQELNGFSKFGNIPSGDDDLFLQRISKSKKYKINFALNPDSFVTAKERKNAKEQINQEKRRASKWRFYPIEIKMFSALIFLFYMLLFSGFVLGLFSIFSLQKFLFMFVIKTVFDFLIIMRGAVLFKEKKLLFAFPFAEIIYIPYFLLFGILGTFSKYKWRESNQFTKNNIYEEKK